MVQLEAEEILHIQVECSEPLPVKDGLDGYLRVIPITGGTVSGKITGEVISGGADWNTEKAGQCSHAFAKYLLRTDDGEYIAIENEGIIAHGSDSFIKTSPRFTADKNGKYAWLNQGVYAGSLQPGEGKISVVIRIYRLL
ncbi:DUF3237 domain-containing protein [Anaerocolumna chitinilytica]|uniref:DUF3237 domain-containing protein n=1 Tax=Anaerocolumna chitinilytica TaxID=1727145 RepID=A0A7I8DLJ5_9FIRM|nr:DUF3237 domain-containing protein [Anaerocolumna chitinilytica]BCJ97915.1 hypothetical protein bsdcttw_09560 [Anaerocolumna chitinilytica]